MFPVTICDLKTVSKLHFNYVKGKGVVGREPGERPAELESALPCGTECASRRLADLTLESVPGAGAQGAHSEASLFSIYLWGSGSPS